MNREEAIRIIKIVLAVAEDFELVVNGEEFTKEKCKEAVDMAIKALEQQTCEDAVSRAAVLDIFADNADATRPYSKTWEEVKALPSVNPQPKMGWIPVSERLPEDYELVLFSTKTDRVFEGRYFADNTNCQWYAFRDETFACNNVVKECMQLPKHYEPQESEVSNENVGMGD